MSAVFVTNLNKNYTGVSSTAAAVLRVLADRQDVQLVGHPLPGCPDPISIRQAYAKSAQPPNGKPFAIWHVRRNTEMRVALWARDVLRHPIRIVFTSAAQRRHSAFPRWLISRMDAVIATTPKAAEFIPHLRAIVPHGVDTTRFTPATDRKAAYAKTGFPGQRGIATIGRVRAEKGTDRFVDAMIDLLPERPDLTALIIGQAKAGDAGFKAELEQRIAASNLTDRILFTGELPAQRLQGVLPALHLLVTLPRYEGYGMTPLEAMSCGVPFVAMKAGFFDEFAGGVAGRVVEQGDLEAACKQIELLCDDPDIHGNAALAARDRACDRYSIETEVDGIERVYDRLWAAG